MLYNLNILNKILIYVVIRGSQCTICILSLDNIQHRQNTFTQNHFFFLLSSNLRVKLPVKICTYLKYF